jgi:hypothetical protein
MRQTWKSLPRDPNRYAHGVRARYVLGCRCVECRGANNVYNKARAKEIRAGRSNELVSAAEARTYMREMSQLGLGRRAFRQACGIGDTTLQIIRNGQRQRIRRQTADRILAVGIEALLPHALVPAAVTHEMIALLLRNGYTKTRLAALMGSTAKTPALQLKAEQIIRKNAERMREVYQMQLARMSGAS